MEKDSRIYVAGYTGLTGSAVVRELKRKGYTNIITGRPELRNQAYTDFWFFDNKIEYVFNCAAHAGGILEAITAQGAMIYDNIMIQSNIIEACRKFKIKKLMNLASSCIYPVDAEQPYTEEQLGDGKTDENWSYAIAKLAGIEMCRGYHKQYGCNFMTAIPCNLYGENDNFDPDKSHVIPALIRKFHEADMIEVWGDGKALREFLYVDDFARGVVMLMEDYNYEDLYDGVINMGSGYDLSIDELITFIREIVANKEYLYNIAKPKGIPSKLMDSSRMNYLGWYPEVDLFEGIVKAYEWYKGGWREDCTSCKSCDCG